MSFEDYVRFRQEIGEALRVQYALSAQILSDAQEARLNAASARHRAARIAESARAAREQATILRATWRYPI